MGGGSGGGSGRRGGGVGNGMGVRVDVNEELNFLGKFKKKLGGVGEVGTRLGGGRVRGAQGGCERRIKVFVKIKKKIAKGGRGGQVGLGWGGVGSCLGVGLGGGQGGCERRIEVFGEIQKKNGGRGRGGGRVALGGGGGSG